MCRFPPNYYISLTPNHFLFCYFKHEYNVHTRQENMTSWSFDLYLLYYIPMIVISLFFCFSNPLSISYVLLIPIAVINLLNVVRAMINMNNFFEYKRKQCLTLTIDIICIITAILSMLYFAVALFTLYHYYEKSAICILTIIQLVWIYIKYIWLVGILINTHCRKCVTTPKQQERKLQRKINVINGAWTDRPEYTTVNLDTITQEVPVQSV